ncbi:MAG: right-handed parallel beta-helix repeat-containing protein [PVC group bacterium]
MTAPEWTKKRPGAMLLPGLCLLIGFLRLPPSAGAGTADGPDNRPPVFSCAPPDRCVFEIGRRAEFRLAAEDPDGTPVRFRTNRFPDGASFDPERQVFNWTPEKGQEGYYLGFEVDAVDRAGNSDKIVFNATVIPAAGDLPGGFQEASAGKTEPGAPGNPGGQKPAPPPTGVPPGGEKGPVGTETGEEAGSPDPGTAPGEEGETIVNPFPTPEGAPSSTGAGPGAETPRPAPSPVHTAAPAPTPGLTPYTTPIPGLTPATTPTPEKERDIFVTTAEDEDEPETDPDNPLGTGLSLREAIKIAQPGWKIRFDLPFGESRIFLSESLVIEKNEIAITGDERIVINAGNVIAGVAFKISGSKNSIRGLEIVDCSSAGIRLDGTASGNLIEENVFFDFENGIVLEGDEVRDNIIRNNDINVGDDSGILITHSGSGSYSLSRDGLLPEAAGVKFMGTTGGLYLDDSPFDTGNNPDPGFCFAGHAEPGTRIGAAVFPASHPYSFATLDPETFIPDQTFIVTTGEDKTLNGTINYSSLSLRQILFYLADKYDKVIFDKSAWSSPFLKLKTPLNVSDDHLYITGGKGEGVVIVPESGASFGEGPGVLIYAAGNMVENLKFEAMPGPAVFLGMGAKDTLLGFGTLLTPWIRGGEIYTSITDANNNQVYGNNYAAFSMIFKNRNLRIVMRFY